MFLRLVELSHDDARAVVSKHFYFYANDVGFFILSLHSVEVSSACKMARGAVSIVRTSPAGWSMQNRESRSRIAEAFF
jgi:hypothetical protein